MTRMPSAVGELGCDTVLIYRTWVRRPEHTILANLVSPLSTLQGLLSPQLHRVCPLQHTRSTQYHCLNSLPATTVVTPPPNSYSPNTFQTQGQVSPGARAAALDRMSERKHPLRVERLYLPRPRPGHQLAVWDCRKASTAATLFRWNSVITDPQQSWQAHGPPLQGKDFVWHS